MSDSENQTILKIASSIAGEVSHRLLARLVEALSQHLHGVFGHFQTLSARPTGGESPAGLGLANVREIALAHCGTVTARSQGKENGSEFRLTLPKSGAAAA